ncbi:MULTISPECIES: hypothetical protein [Legionella]|uniref:Uncharacterized protein n=1 Tax=Legionella drozanskii LLAP-1 TaxID=1212489 RepID=A0A0W0SM42_9GAMM|nr:MULTISPECIES: hypothetical protein [Legionella]KTC84382.1 hypothetical protein Ldro_2985 [Legionella drozanskii LLAP-1]PJE06867.1 MAG: hypothetical protein CK430_14630 [Legionella sp.]
MGCDIHVEIDLYQNDKWIHLNEWDEKYFNPFPHRNYSIFGFLGNVRNRDGTPYITDNRGLTADREEEIQRACDEIDKAVEEGDIYWGRPDLPYDYLAGYHGISWVLLSELLEYDYSQTFIHKGLNKEMSLKEYLGDGFMEILKDTLNHYSGISAQNIRIFFYFDN